MEPEKILLQILLAEPWLIPKAITRIKPDDISDPDLCRLLTELYALHAFGQPADMTSLMVRLIDKPHLVRLAQRLLDSGRHIADRPGWLARLKFAGHGGDLGDMGPLPKIHPRHSVMSEAGNDLGAFLLDWKHKHALTSAEYIAILAGLIQGLASQLISIKRRHDGSSPTGG